MPLSPAGTRPSRRTSRSMYAVAALMSFGADARPFIESSAKMYSRVMRSAGVIVRRRRLRRVLERQAHARACALRCRRHGEAQKTASARQHYGEQRIGTETNALSYSEARNVKHGKLHAAPDMETRRVASCLTKALP